MHDAYVVYDNEQASYEHRSLVSSIKISEYHSLDYRSVFMHDSKKFHDSICKCWRKRDANYTPSPENIAFEFEYLTDHSPEARAK